MSKSAYTMVVGAFKTRKKGATPADIAASTGLPLNTVKELVPKAADEYSGRLEVTESGEILYSFPRGFNSRYRGFIPFCKKFLSRFIQGSITAGTLLFKIWIMVMLLGYFVLFIAIALGSLFLSMAANSSNNRSRRGSAGNMYLSMGIFNMIIRLWFYSELTKSFNQSYGYVKQKKPSKPLHRAIFSFVFGDGDPNAKWKDLEKKTIISFLQEHKGVISLPEFMIMTGLKPDEAEVEISSFCVEFNGSPEATEDGTVVYRFDELLLRSDTKKEKKAGLPLLFKRPAAFSSNPEKMNFWFSVINAVNLFFGSYFLYNAATIGNINMEAAHGIYSIIFVFVSLISNNPLAIITAILGIVPVIFSILFWLIPSLRRLFLNKKNEKIKLENFRKFSFSKIWNKPIALKKLELKPVYQEASPVNLDKAQDMVIKEMGAYVIPEVALDDAKIEVYDFAELKREKEALEKYRTLINPDASSLGNTVFDTEG